MRESKHVDWNVVADEYDEAVGDSGDFCHRTYLNPVILPLLGKIKGKKILDLGCGQGYLARMLAKKGAVITGIDVSERLLGIAKKHEKKETLGINYYLADADNLEDIETASINVVLVNMVFHSVDDIEDTIAECARVLLPRGRLVFSLPHPLKEVGERKQDSQGYHLVLRKYRSDVEVSHSLYGDKGYKAWYRSIARYLEMLFSNGFVVANFKEIYTQHSKGKTVKEKKLVYKQEFPSFLIVESVLSEADKNNH